jgi:hypothetical protein
MQVVKGFEGGPETFFSLAWTSHISSYDSLSTRLDFCRAPASSETNFGLAIGETAANFQEIFTDFLKGSGIPCPSLFANVRGYISPLIDLTTIDQPGFRAHMFCWAATGSPSVELSGSPIEVRILQGLFIGYYTYLLLDLLHLR